MGINGKVLCVNMLNTQWSNDHLKKIAYLLNSVSILNDIVFFSPDIESMKRYLAQRRISLVYIIAHAEKSKGIVYNGQYLDASQFGELFGKHLPQNIFINCCFGDQLGYGHYFNTHGCENALVGKGFIDIDMAVNCGTDFFNKLLETGSVGQSMSYLDGTHYSKQ